MPVEKTKKKTKTPYVASEKAFDISPSADGGVLKEIIKEGSGEYFPTSGCKVSVHYEGTLTDGTIFDSSRQRSPFEFNLGKGSVIKAWDIGVATMKRGEIAVLTCKSEYAYGAAGSPPTIPPDATLIFEIEVLDWQAEDLSQKKDGGILRQVIEPGEGHATPNEGSVVDIQIIGECLGRVFDERTVSFTLGEGQDLNIPPGVERALEKFKLKERSRLELKAAHGWGHTGNTVLAVPSNADLIYTVTLNNFERMKEAWALDAEDKLKQAKFHKEKGTDYFKAQKYELAIKMYKRAIQFVEFNEGFEAEAEDERKPLVLVLHLNTAACHLKLEQYVAARDSASLALGVLPTSEKGLFRRGQALLELGEPEKAKADFEQLLRLDPANKAAAHQLTVCAQRLQEQLVKEKKIYANMFEKFARRDREDCRFGWWDGKGVVVEETPFNAAEELEEERRESIARKKKSLEVTRRLREERETRLREEKAAVEEEKPRETTCCTLADEKQEKEKEEEERQKQPDVMKTLGEWGQDEREREPTDFEKENPNILMLDGNGDFKNM